MGVFDIAGPIQMIVHNLPEGLEVPDPGVVDGDGVGTTHLVVLKSDLQPHATLLTPGIDLADSWGSPFACGACAEAGSIEQVVEDCSRLPWRCSVRALARQLIDARARHVARIGCGYALTLQKAHFIILDEPSPGVLKVGVVFNHGI